MSDLVPSNTLKSAFHHLDMGEQNSPQQRRQQLIRFHNCHGNNIILDHDNTIAYRNSSYPEAIVFSERPLQPGELFVIEIQDTDAGEGRHLRLGLTQLFPKVFGPKPKERLTNYKLPNWMQVRRKYLDSGLQYTMPKYAWPDMETLGNTWLHQIHLNAMETTKNIKRSPIEDDAKTLNSNDCVNIKMFESEGDGFKNDIDVLGPSAYVRTSGGLMAKHFLYPSSGQVCPEKGSRIGIIYVPTEHDESLGEMHIILNGKDLGALTKSLPINELPVHVVIDMFGRAKRIRIVQPKMGKQ